MKNLKKIGRKLGHIDTIDLSAGRLLVEVDIRKPLIFTKKVQSPGGDKVTIQFKYEKLFKHCSHCGFLSHESTYYPKKMEEQRLHAKEAGVFSRVHLPFEPNTRQSLLADRTERDRYHSLNDRKPELRDGRKSENFKIPSFGASYKPRDDRFPHPHDNENDKNLPFVGRVTIDGPNLGPVIVEGMHHMRLPRHNLGK